MKPRIVLPVLTILGLLGLAPVWYQSNISRLARHFVSEQPTSVQESVPSPVIHPLPLIHPPPIAKKQHGTEPQQSPHSSQGQASEPADKATDWQTRAAINFFQTNAELLTARLNPELADQLDRDASDSSNDP